MCVQHRRLALHEVARSQSDDESVLGQIARLLITAGSDVDAISSDFGEVGIVGCQVKRCCYASPQFVRYW